MEKPLVLIVAKYVEGPFGGGTQFAKALRREFIKSGRYAVRGQPPDILLFNANPSSELWSMFRTVYRLKKKKRNTICVMRIDGPVISHRPLDKPVDKMFYTFAKSVMDGVVFQSKWSRKENIKNGIDPNFLYKIISNSPDPSIFNASQKQPLSPGRKIRLIGTSWSSNWRKGFKSFQWIDEHLDFSRYDMTFVGNSPVKFNNIKLKPPMDSRGVANELRKHDIFIFPSEKEACSNALLEALHCGLPVVALNSGSSRDIIGKGGECFDSPQQIPGLLEKITNHYSHYQSGIEVQSMREIAQQYYLFMEKIWLSQKRNQYKSKRPGFYDFLKILVRFGHWRLESIKREVKSHLTTEK